MIRVLASVLLLLATRTGASPGVHEQVPADIDTYLIGPRDVLTITVFDEPQLTGRYRVDNDGTITFPLIGRIAAGGLTPRSVEIGLKKQLGDKFSLQRFHDALLSHGAPPVPLIHDRVLRELAEAVK